MKALILNSGIGRRMGEINHPKSMSLISENETILSRQLKLLSLNGIRDVVITTGPYENQIIDYCYQQDLQINFQFIHNDRYAETNYIYSLYLASKEFNDDFIIMHGDLVFEASVLEDVINSNNKSIVVVSSTQELPEKDFKAVIENNIVKKIGIEFFNNAQACQPLYKLEKETLLSWSKSIKEFIDKGDVNCYAENALNQISETLKIEPLDIKSRLCHEIDNQEDLKIVSSLLKQVLSKTVYMCFSSDILHNAHMSIIKKASQYGNLIIGVLSDEAVATYKRYPLLSFNERKQMIKNIKGVTQVVMQKTLSYRENIEKIKPDYVVHGDEWRNGFQKSIREEVIELLSSYGGILKEFPSSSDVKYKLLELRGTEALSLPDIRRARLKNLLKVKKCLSIMEAHNGITGLIVENTKVFEEGKVNQFDGMWISSLCDSTSRGKPDIELVDMSARFRTIDEIMEVTTKPIIFDGDTGGLAEHFVYTVKTLERMGVSMVIIEDKIGLKKNSLFGTEVKQTQDTIEHFCEKIVAGKKAQKTKDFMICARIESLILEKGLEDALNRAFAYEKAGADAIMIHSRKKDPAEIFEFVKRFREINTYTPIVVVPTSFNDVTEQEFASRGINIVIYANQLTRSGFPAMKKTAESILKNHRSKECDSLCMPIKEIITLIPSE